MPTIDATFTNPAIRRIDRADATWFLAGADDADPASIHRLTSTFDGAAFCREHGDALVACIQTGDHPRVRLWKALFSTQETWFAVRPDRSVVVADHFRNAVAALPVEERTVTDEIITGHFLTRKVYGTGSYLAPVSRLAHATEVDIDPTAGTWTSRQFDRIADDAEKRPASQYLAAIDEALLRSLDSIRNPDDTALFFSGGVDSTLVLALDPDLMQPLTFVPDSPEFGEETRYARRAAALLGRDLIEVPVAEEDFVENLEMVVDTIGFPPFDDSSPYFERLMADQPYSTFVFGLGADSAFGMSLKIAKLSNWFRFPGLRHGLAAAAPRTPGHLGYRMRQVSSRANAFAREPLHPDGFAGDTRTHGDTSVFESTVSPELPHRVKAAQLTYVTDRVEGAGTRNSTFLSHIELGHWMTVFGNALYEERMVTNPLGRAATCPYADAGVMRELARIPLEDRYIDGYRAKWILKDLLRQKVPEYPVDQRKKATALPWERFYLDGPLSGIWDRYDIPDLFPPAAQEQLRSDPTATTWNAITWAMWDERIRRNPDLKPHPAVASLSADFS